jgi:hypothetical protein
VIALIMAVCHNLAELCVPNVRHGQVGFGAPVDTMRLAWTRVGVRPAGERQRLTCADVRSGLMSRSRAGRIRTGDPLTPRTMRHAPPAKTATAGAENGLPSPRFRTIRRCVGDTVSQGGPIGPQRVLIGHHSAARIARVAYRRVAPFANSAPRSRRHTAGTVPRAHRRTTPGHGARRRYRRPRQRNGDTAAAAPARPAARPDH